MLKKLIFVILGLTMLASQAVFAKAFERGNEEKIRLVATTSGTTGGGE